MIPEATYQLYDFMANYSRGENGTSYYMGIPISSRKPLTFLLPAILYDPACMLSYAVRKRHPL